MSTGPWINSVEDKSKPLPLCTCGEEPTVLGDIHIDGWDWGSMYWCESCNLILIRTNGKYEWYAPIEVNP